MIRIIDEQGTGKTSRLMLLAKEHDATFVCSNPKAMEYKAKAYGITGLRFMSYGDFLLEPSMSHEGNYVIDELEQFVLEATYGPNARLVAYSMSKD